MEQREWIRDPQEGRCPNPFIGKTMQEAAKKEKKPSSICFPLPKHIPILAMVKMNLTGFFQTLYPEGVLVGSAFLENKGVICASFSRAWCRFCDSVNRAQLFLLPLPTLLKLVNFPGRRHYQVRPPPLIRQRMSICTEVRVRAWMGGSRSGETCSDGL